MSAICNKASQKLHALSRVCRFMGLTQCKILMRSFILSQFGYYPLVWMFHSRKLNCRINKFPPNRRLFLPTIFRNIKCRTNRYSNSFFPDDIASWNNMITHFEHFPTFDNLIKHMLSLIRPEAKLIYGIHDSIGLRYLFQLRVSFLHNFVDTPSDICHCNQGIEDTNHFLFSCPTCVNQRAALVISVNEILRENNLNQLGDYLWLYLYGHASISPSDNRLILVYNKLWTDTLELRRFAKINTCESFYQGTYVFLN